jgi:hypothetical protein
MLFLYIIPMVPSSALVVAADDEHLSCGGFSLGETIFFGSLEFITDYFGGWSLSPRGTAQAPSSWAPPTAGHHSRSGPWRGTPPMVSPWLLPGMRGPTSPLL